jgi:hypothetical protein
MYKCLRWETGIDILLNPPFFLLHRFHSEKRSGFLDQPSLRERENHTDALRWGFPTSHPARICSSPGYMGIKLFA